VLSKQLFGTRVTQTGERKRKFRDSKNVNKPRTTQTGFKHRLTSPMNTPTKLAVQDLREEGVNPSPMPRFSQKLSVRHEAERALINVTPRAVAKDVTKSIKLGSGNVRAAVLHVSISILHQKNRTRWAFCSTVCTKTSCGSLYRMIPPVCQETGLCLSQGRETTEKRLF
jgi:hypothetical protein